MSFLKTDGLVFEDDDELEDEETDEETEMDDETPDEESPEEDDDGEDAEQSDEENAEKASLKRLEKNRLKKILKTAPWRFYPHLTWQEKLFLKRMEKKGYGFDVRAIRSSVDLRQQAFKIKANTVITTASPFIGILAIIIFIIIAVVVIIGTLMPWLFPDDENGGGNKGAASPFGMKGDKFYGGRVVYRDDVLAQNGLVEQYVDVLETSVENLQTATYTTIEKDDKTYQIKVSVDITQILPSEDFNYEALDLTAFATDYSVLYNIVGDIAKLSYKVDNNIENDADIPTELTDILNGVKYFGFSAEMLGSSIVDEDSSVDNNIIEIVYDILANSSYVQVLAKGESDADFVQNASIGFEDVKEQFKTSVKNSIKGKIEEVRTEKLFIKDIILDGDDKYMEGIEKKNYVALIYLPKQSVEFDYVSYMITIDKDAEFSAVLSNNGNEITLTKGEGENWSTDEEETEPKELTYTFKSGENLGQTAGVSDVVNVADLNKFSNPSSLFKIVTNSTDYTTYLQETTLENGDTVLTYKTGNMFILFETDAEFMFNEELKY